AVPRQRRGGGRDPADLHRRGRADLARCARREWPAGAARPERQRGIPSRRQRGSPGRPDGQPLRGAAAGHTGPEPPGSAAMRPGLTPLTRDRMLQLIGRMKTSRVVVVGDIMLDRYLVGETDRLSPEAPVPVVTVRELHGALGG